jgi:hypothetical protein
MLALIGLELCTITGDKKNGTVDMWSRGRYLVTPHADCVLVLLADFIRAKHYHPSEQQLLNNRRTSEGPLNDEPSTSYASFR